MRQTILMLILLAAFRSPDAGAQETTTFTVTYLSADHVYISGGAEDGLSVGDQLQIISGGEEPALEVIYVAGHSASCRLLIAGALPPVGTRVRLIRGPEGDITPAVPDSTAVPTAMEPAVTSPEPQSVALPLPPRVTGLMSIGYYHWADQSPANLDFHQTNARLNLKAEHILDEHVTIAVRTRGRFDARNRAYADLGQDSWENRLWEASVRYDNPNGPVAFAVGRILPYRVSTAGYLDGALVEWRASPSLRIGALGGTRPDWLYRTEGMSIARFGSYVSFVSSERVGLASEQTLGGIVESHAGTTSRIYLLTRGRIVTRGNWGMSHSAEIDVNSAWRQEKAGQSVSLSRAFVNIYWQASRALRLSVNYDNFRRYWTYEYRSVADSLFDDRVRQGLRGRIDWRLSNNWRISTGAGLRDIPDEPDPTVSYSFSVRRTNVFSPRLSMSAYVSGFDGAGETGNNFSIQMSALSSRFGMISLRTGRYRYSVKSVDLTRQSRSFGLGIDRDIAGDYFISGLTEYNSGDDINGWRLQTELGYRF